MSGSSGMRSLDHLIDHELNDSAVGRAKSRLRIPVSGLLRRLTRGGHAGNNSELFITRERPSRNHAICVAQRELSGQRARRGANSSDRWSAARSASENEQNRLRAELIHGASFTQAHVELHGRPALLRGRRGSPRRRRRRAELHTQHVCQLLRWTELEQPRPALAPCSLQPKLLRDEPAVPECLWIVRLGLEHL